MNKKKKNILAFSSFLIVLIISLTLYSQRYYLLKYLPSSLDTNYSYQDGIMVDNKTRKSFSGRLRSEYDNRVDIISYKNGLMHGMSVSYRDGKTIETGYYKDNMQHGLFRLYSDDGILLNESNFFNNKFEGVSRKYYPSNGQLHQESNYINGLLDGNVKQYNEEGVLILQMRYTKGAPNGQAYHYYNDGKLKVDVFFDINEEDDLGINATYWDEFGNGVRGTFYADGTFYPEILEDKALSALSPKDDEINTKKLIEHFKSLFINAKSAEAYETEFINHRAVANVEDSYNINGYLTKTEYDENNIPIRMIGYFPNGKKGIMAIYNTDSIVLRTITYADDGSGYISKVEDFHYVKTENNLNLIGPFTKQEIEFSSNSQIIFARVNSYSDSEEFLGRKVYQFFEKDENSFQYTDEHFELQQYNKYGNIFKTIVLDKALNLVSVSKYDKNGSRTSFIEY